MSAKHGTRRCYEGGCHCDACKAANSMYERERVARRANGEAPLLRRAPVVTLPEQQLPGRALLRRLLRPRWLVCR
jgi:hypothetical protein